MTSLTVETKSKTARDDRGVAIALAFALIGLVLSLAVVWHDRGKAYGQSDEEPRIAAHIARGHGYLNPIDQSAAAPPTSWTPPIYPYLMAAAYKVWGVNSHGAVNAMLALNAGCFAAVAAGTYVLGRSLFGPRAGAVAAVLFLVHPMFLLRTPYCWDTFPGLALFVWLAVAALAIRRAGATPLRLALLGGGLAILALTNASYVLLIPLLTLTATAGLPVVRQAKLSLIAAAIFVVLITPWTIRNYAVFHKLFFIRGGVNLELWIGNQPGHDGWINLTNHPSIKKSEGRLMTGLGENAYFKLCGDRFRENFKADPAGFYRRCVNRFCFLFVSDPYAEGAISLANTKGSLPTIARVSLDVIVLVVGLIGAGMALARRQRGAWPLLIAVAAGVPFVFTHVSYRYTMPVRLMLLTTGAVFVVAIWDRLQTRIKV